MKHILILLCLICSIACNKQGDVLLHETGVVVAKQYSPETNTSGTTINTNGTVGFHNLTSEQMFNVVFKCDHGVVFTINSDIVYAKLNENDTVTIDYYEIFNNSNKVVDYEFIDANKQ